MLDIYFNEYEITYIIDFSSCRQIDTCSSPQIVTSLSLRIRSPEGSRLIGVNCFIYEFRSLSVYLWFALLNSCTVHLASAVYSSLLN